MVRSLDRANDDNDDDDEKSNGQGDAENELLVPAAWFASRPGTGRIQIQLSLGPPRGLCTPQLQGEHRRLELVQVHVACFLLDVSL